MVVALQEYVRLVRINALKNASATSGRSLRKSSFAMNDPLTIVGTRNVQQPDSSIVAQNGVRPRLIDACPLVST